MNQNNVHKTGATSIQVCVPHTLSCSSSAQCKISISNCNFPECSRTLASAAVTNGRYQSADGPLPINPEEQKERDTKSETDIKTRRDGFKERERYCVYMYQVPHQEFLLWLCLWHLVFDWARGLDLYFPLHHPLSLWHLCLSYETDGGNINIRANLALCRI